MTARTAAAAEPSFHVGNTPNETLKAVLISLLLAAATVVAFGGVTGAGFINIDDPRYISENAAVQRGLSWENLKWAFTTFYFSNWHPLTWLSYMLDCELFGVNPGAMHAMNLVLHVGNVLLLFLLLKRMTRELWGSAIVAALFAVHPLHVESVAWISERKDVLSTLLWLLTMWAYLEYVRKRCAGWHAGALMFFALGLMSKAMLVTLPFVLLLIDFWPLRRIEIGKGARSAGMRPLILEKIPFFALAAISSYLTVLAQRSGGALSSFAMLPLGQRLENAVISYVRYLGKTFWPADLVVLYPPPPNGWSGLQVAGATLLIIGITTVAVRCLRRMPYLFVGWGWFVGTLVPVIGIVQVGGQSMADRYTYVPHIGLFIAIVWAARELLLARNALRLPAVGLAAAVLVALAVLTNQQTRFWKDSFSLLTHASQRAGPSALILNNLGQCFLERGNIDAATKEFQTALEMFPEDPLAWGNLGNVHFRQGRLDQAIESYRNGLRRTTNSPQMHFNIGLALAAKEDWRKAIDHYHRALEIDSQQANVYLALGNAYMGLGEIDNAVTNYLILLRLRPGNAAAHYSVGNARLAQGRTQEAIQRLTEAVRLEERFAAGHRQLGVALQQAGRGPEALAHFERAVAIDGADFGARAQFAAALAGVGQDERAISEYREALKLNTNSPVLLNNLAWTLATHSNPGLRNGAEAVRLAEQAVELTQRKEPLILGTLAAAYAEAGRFDEATRTAEEAINLAEQTGQKDLISKNKELLASYRQQRPWREPLKGL